ncbi:MAG TPA: orotate phosphoribosyltransferase [Bacillota bacterium]|nr:orotate phosphoribosyltransferase [Bacillota bacterium]
MTVSKQVAKSLLEIKAVQIRTKNYFTWTSGIKSPIYCDNRLTMSYPDVRKQIIQAFKEKVLALDVQPDIIAGCATAGIPHASWLAYELDLPLVYVRSTPKGHGKGNQIEGHVSEGDRVVLIEDLISTGGSALDAAKALKEVGASVDKVLAIFTYGLSKSVDQFKAAQMPYDTITNYDHLLQLLLEEGKISEEEKSELQLWRNRLT